MKHHHITQGALNAEGRSRGKVAVWNDSLTIELTMSVQEVLELEERFFIDIDSTIPDATMGKLLHHFRDSGCLFDKEDMSRI